MKTETESSRFATQLHLIDPTAARHYIDSCPYERQRMISDAHVSFLASEMKRGSFTEATAIHFVECAGRLHLVNGRHRLYAVIEAGIAVLFTFMVTKVATDAAMHEIYADHDVHRPRDWSAALRAYGIYDAYKTIADKGAVNAFGAATLMIMTGLDQVAGALRQDASIAKSRNLRKKAIEECQPYAERVFHVIGTSEGRARRQLKRSPVFAVALETFRYQPAVAGQFWARLAADDGLHRGEPQKTLLDWLVEHPGGSVSLQHQVNAVAAGWNAAMAHRMVEFLRPDAMKHFILAGTPYEKERRPLPLACMVALVARARRAPAGKRRILTGQRVTPAGDVVPVTVMED